MAFKMGLKCDWCRICFEQVTLMQCGLGECCVDCISQSGYPVYVGSGTVHVRVDLSWVSMVRFGLGVKLIHDWR